MPDCEYSNREIDLLFKGIKQHIDESVVPTLNRIEAQTIKNNGRSKTNPRDKTR